LPRGPFRATVHVVIATERLLLRRFTQDDAAFVLELVNDPDFHRNIGDRGVRTEGDARAAIAARFEQSYERNGFGLYLVRMKDAETPIGMCGLIRRDTLPDVDIGYAFLPAYRSRGYAVEAARATVAHARDDFGLKRLVAIVLPQNAPSIRVLEAIGLAFERNIRLPGDDAEIALFAVDF